MIREVRRSETDYEPPEEARSESDRPHRTPQEKPDDPPVYLPIRSEVQPVQGVWRAIYVTLAILFFVLGIIGAILPVIPTTPFLLLTSFFLARISPRLNHMLMQVPLVGAILRDWNERRGVRPTVKIQAIIIVLCIVASALYFTGLHLVGKWILGVLALVGILVILKIPTLPPANRNAEFV